MAVEDEVRQASEQFYAALNSTINGDPGPMMEVWSHGSDASAMHPFGSRSLGWEEVRASWEQAARAISDGRVSDHQRGVDEEVVVPMGDDAAYTVGTERGQAKIGDELVRVDWRVTNIYRREGGDGRWCTTTPMSRRRWWKPSACRRAKKGVVEGRTVAAPALLFAPIHRSAWNRNSAKYVPQQQRRFRTGLRCLRYSSCNCRTIEGQCLSK